MQLSKGISGLGVGQTWQNQVVGVDRINNVTYTNTTGRPIFVMVNTNRSGTMAGEFTLDGEVVLYLYQDAASNSLARDHFYAVIPNGSTYKVNVSTGNIMKWMELR